MGRLLILRQWAREYGPAILPVLATIAVTLPMACYAADQVGGQPAPTGWVRYISWSRYAPEWLTRGFLVVLITGSLAFIACWTAVKYKIGANLAAVAGFVTTATLTWATQWCDQTGGIVVGLTIAGVIVAAAVCFEALKEKGVWKALLEGRGVWRALDDWWSNSVSKQTSIGTVQFAQISIAIYMGSVALIAMMGGVPGESRWDVLTFAGIGITAASALSEKRNLKNFLALVGVGIALWGSYIEMDRTLAMGGGEVNAATVMLAAGIVIYVPLTALALRGRHMVRILIAPMPVAGLATCMTLVVTGVPAVLITVGCGTGAAPTAFLIGGAGFLSIAVGFLVFCLVTALAFRSWWKQRNAATPNANG